MSAPMTPEQRKAIAVQIGDVQPATDRLIGSFAESVANVRNHEHPSWEDLYCMNLTSYMGERMAPVLKRLLDAETENARLRARVVELETQAETVTAFCAQYITSILNCHPDNAHDYNRWQGHAESRRQLSQSLGLPVAWPPGAEAAPARDEEPEASRGHCGYDDYHDAHEWADRPHVWCPGHSYADDEYGVHPNHPAPCRVPESPDCTCPQSGGAL
ncbi:hypothetical protein [Streptomyces griseus]|uniref:hypothetical protein n=1 Tax=Streptomyces griseus TaxID=1911 RepID=UPI0036F73D03